MKSKMKWDEIKEVVYLTFNIFNSTNKFTTVQITIIIGHKCLYHNKIVHIIIKIITHFTTFSILF